jgi:hypothetical protein
MIMQKLVPLDLTRIKKIASDILAFPAKIETTAVAKNARHLLKKYAQVSEKIEKNVLIREVYKKDLLEIRTDAFKKTRSQLKEKANLVLHSGAPKTAKSEKVVKKTAKKPAQETTKETKTETPKKAVKKAVKDPVKKSVKKTTSKSAASKKEA